MSTTNQSSGVLAFSNLSYTVKTKDGPKSLVENVSLDVRDGEMIGEQHSFPCFYPRKKALTSYSAL
jgi:hypothetical protein